MFRPQEQAQLGAAAADLPPGPGPAVAVNALPDTPSQSGIEVHVELVQCPWADDSLDPADRTRLGLAWNHLDPLSREQASYLLLRMLKDLENGERPKFERNRTGALAVLPRRWHHPSTWSPPRRKSRRSETIPAT